MISKLKYIFIYLIVSFGHLTYSQDISVPIDVQIELLPKILSLNKAFDFDQKETVIKVGILYSDRLRASVKVKDEILTNKATNEIQIKKAQVLLFPIEIESVANYEKYLTLNEINVLYLTPLRGYDISEIAKVCKKDKIITVTGVSNYIDENLASVGFQLENKKLQITINLESAIDEGANFSSQLLKVSQVK